MRFTLRQDQRTKKLNYAKQSQFPDCSNTRKLCINNGLCQYTPPQPLQKQTQSKPIQSQSNPISTQIRRKQTQSNPTCSEHACTEQGRSVEPFSNQSSEAVPQRIEQAAVPAQRESGFGLKMYGIFNFLFSSRVLLPLWLHPSF